MAGRRTEEQLYAELKSFPRPKYEFPDQVSPLMEALAAEYNEWIDVDCPFESSEAREAHKRHRLTDIAARAFPWLTLAELRPIALFTAFLAILDDFMDRSGRDELQEVRDRMCALLTGVDDDEPEPGFYHQMYMIRQDALVCEMPPHLYQGFFDSILTLMTGFGDEKRYNAANRPAPFAAFESIRRQTSGGLPFARYLCMQKEYRRLPARVLGHATILRMHDLASTLIGYHNDFISLPKELACQGDVVNLVLTVQHELGLSLKEAYWKALEIHDAHLAEFVELQNNLLDFGEWQSAAQEYATDLGIMVQGVYSWHVKNTGRYSPGAYVEPEHGGGGLKHKQTCEAGAVASVVAVSASVKRLSISVVAALATPLTYAVKFAWTATRFGRRLS